MKNRRKTLFALTGLLLCLDLRAQDSLRLGLDDAIRMGLAGNKSLQAESFNLERDAYQLKQGYSALLPSITGNAGLTHYFNAPVQYVAANTLNPASSSHAYLGLSLLLPNAFTAGINVNWALYNQAIFSALKVIKTQDKITQLQLQKDRSELAFSISQLYYGIIFAIKQRENLGKIAANLDRLLDLLQPNYDNGLLLKTELDKVSVNKTTTLSQIAELSAAIESQSNLLKQLLGVALPVPLKLSTTDYDNSLRPLPDTPASAAGSFDLRIIRAQAELTQLERRVIAAAGMPTLGLAYSYSYNSVSPDLSKTIGSRFDFPVQFIGLNLSVPLFNGYSNTLKLKENAVQVRQIRLQADDLQEKIATGIVNARLRYTVSLTNMHSNQANVDLAQGLYNQSLEQYQQGTILLTDVLTFETSLEQALTQYFNSVSNALLSLLEYQKATNTLLSQ
jgi:outer membrane protein TolC